MANPEWHIFDFAERGLREPVCAEPIPWAVERKKHDHTGRRPRRAELTEKTVKRAGAPEYRDMSDILPQDEWRLNTGCSN